MDNSMRMQTRLWTILAGIKAATPKLQTCSAWHMHPNHITRTQELIAAKFSQLPNYTPTTIASFVQQYFAPAGTDLRPCTPADWSANPPFLSAIHNATLRAFASDVHSIWPSLCRQVQVRAANNFCICVCWAMAGR